MQLILVPSERKDGAIDSTPARADHFLATDKSAAGHARVTAFDHHQRIPTKRGETA
jgi:hypothetical protein